MGLANCGLCVILKDNDYIFQNYLKHEATYPETTTYSKQDK